MEAGAQDTREKKARVWARAEFDWYVEPQRATAQLLQVEAFEGIVWDPACGQGNIVSACQDAGVPAVGTDVLQRINAHWFSGEADFLEMDFPMAHNIITNPPFFRARGTEAFIRHALKLAPRKIAVFSTLQFLAGAKRAEGLFSEFPPNRVWIVTPRVSCPPGEHLQAGGKAQGDTKDWCWMVWDKGSPASMTELGWLKQTKGN